MTAPGARDPFSLAGRVALVTGGGSGLGRAISLGLARQGAGVAVADISESGAWSTAEAILAANGTAIAIHADVTDLESVTHMFDRAEMELGLVDILVNDAFVPAPKVPSETTPLRAWEQVMKVNLTGYFMCAQEAGRRLIRAGHGGSIVNLSSITGSTGTGRGLLAYGVSKGAINQLTRELAVEWAPFGIRVNAIQPCQMLTPALQALLDDPTADGQSLVADFLRGIPLGRLGLPEDVVGPVVFLASDAAAMVTGALLPVDGGNLAMNAGGTLRTP